MRLTERTGLSFEIEAECLEDNPMSRVAACVLKTTSLILKKKGGRDENLYLSLKILWGFRLIQITVNSDQWVTLETLKRCQVVVSVILYIKAYFRE